MGKQKEPGIVEKISFVCPDTGEQVTVEAAVYITASEQVCETCGSHGEVNVSCPACKRDHELYSW